MEVSDKEQRKMLNAAWDKGQSRWFGPWVENVKRIMGSKRYRDVTKIIKATEKQRKDGRDERM